MFLLQKRLNLGEKFSFLTWDTESINHSFYDTLKQIDIRNVLNFVDQHCQFLDSFEHILGCYAKQNKENRILIACLIAWGTNMGLGRMGEISDISYPLLAATSDNFIRLETLKEANDRISNAIAKSPIFKYIMTLVNRPILVVMDKKWRLESIPLILDIRLNILVLVKGLFPTQW